MRTIRPLASLILLPATIGLAAAYVWHACTARWDIPPAASPGTPSTHDGDAGFRPRTRGTARSRHEGTARHLPHQPIP